jgi:hypothetical protein
MFVTEPGRVELVIACSLSSMDYGMIARKVAVQAVAGQASFIGPGPGQLFGEIPAEKALKGDGILYCTKVEQAPEGLT